MAGRVNRQLEIMVEGAPAKTVKVNVIDTCVSRGADGGLGGGQGEGHAVARARMGLEAKARGTAAVP